MHEYQVTEHKCAKCTVRIHRPILTEEEYKIREEKIKAALVLFAKEKMSKCLKN
jgi:hypothetical protein